LYIYSADRQAGKIKDEGRRNITSQQSENFQSFVTTREAP
jgi:hypothetical protein